MTPQSPVFIGCACDHTNVEPTAVMLSSVDLNAGLPGASVLVAGVNLEGRDRAMLRAGAGGLGPGLRFVDAPAGSLPETVAARMAGGRALARLERLFLPARIAARGARLIALDSDLIVQSALEPLTGLDLGGRVCAAVGDRTASDPRDAFDSGVMVVDVDGYNASNIAARCISWLIGRAYSPSRPDQDALNAVIGDDWLALDGMWNVVDKGRAVGPDPYTAAAVVRGASEPTPGAPPSHPQAALYAGHLARLQARLERRTAPPEASGRDLLATCYEVLLGRELEDGPVIRDREGWPAAEIVRSILESPEFRSNVLGPLQRGVPFPAGLFAGRPTIRQRFWAADQLPVSATSAARLLSASRWTDVLAALLSDADFAEAMALPFPTLPDVPGR